jgi:hypothetical protein
MLAGKICEQSLLFYIGGFALPFFFGQETLSGPDALAGPFGDLDDSGN